MFLIKKLVVKQNLLDLVPVFFFFSPFSKFHNSFNWLKLGWKKDICVFKIKVLESHNPTNFLPKIELLFITSHICMYVCI